MATKNCVNSLKRSNREGRTGTGGRGIRILAASTMLITTAMLAQTIQGSDISRSAYDSVISFKVNKDR
jgi:hypothetical protein